LKLRYQSTKLHHHHMLLVFIIPHGWLFAYKKQLYLR